MIYMRKSYNKDSLDTTIQHVREHISACCSPSDDPAEYADQVIITTQEYPDDGSIMVTGDLKNHGPKADYFSKLYAPVLAGPSSTVHEPVDFDADQLADHLARKSGAQL